MRQDHTERLPVSLRHLAKGTSSTHFNGLQSYYAHMHASTATPPLLLTCRDAWSGWRLLEYGTFELVQHLLVGHLCTQIQLLIPEIRRIILPSLITQCLWSVTLYHLIYFGRCHGSEGILNNAHPLVHLHYEWEWFILSPKPHHVHIRYEGALVLENSRTKPRGLLVQSYGNQITINQNCFRHVRTCELYSYLVFVHGHIWPVTKNTATTG